MSELSGNQQISGIEFIHPLSANGLLPRSIPEAANNNRRDGHLDYPFGYNPRAVAEAEQLAVEAMYLGADILEMLKRVDVEMSKDLTAETARLAKILMFWGVGAISLAGTTA